MRLLVFDCPISSTFALLPLSPHSPAPLPAFPSRKRFPFSSYQKPSLSHLLQSYPRAIVDQVGTALSFGFGLRFQFAILTIHQQRFSRTAIRGLHPYSLPHTDNYDGRHRQYDRSDRPRMVRDAYIPPIPIIFCSPISSWIFVIDAARLQRAYCTSFSLINCTRIYPMSFFVRGGKQHCALWTLPWIVKIRTFPYDTQKSVNAL